MAWCADHVIGDTAVPRQPWSTMSSTTSAEPPPRDAAARFQAPTYVRNVVDRERLIDLLRAGANRQFVVIHAPAGYGKTTLAVQWLRVLENEGSAVAWLGMHRDDNDPHWFLSHLLETVGAAIPEASDAVRDLQGLIEQSGQDMHGYTLTTLVELIARHERQVVITFDDWHVVDEPQVHRALVHLLDFAPPNLALILTSRTRPRLPLSRLRVRKQLIEIDADALRFDAAETHAFLNDLNGLRLGRDEVASVSAGTDGWVAALQLVSLSLRECTDPGPLIAGFSGRDSSVGEYLTENVLGALPEDILDFLLATSVCDRLCGDLASALTGRDDGQTLLEEIERRDLFLRPLDNEREWFRYHHLFADYLRRRQQRDHPDRIATLHVAASVWFADHELVAEAVTHALAAGDVSGAADLVERDAMQLVEHSRMVSLLGLTARLPAGTVDDRPELLMAIAWANCLLQRAEPALLALDHVRQAIPSDPSHEERHSEADVVQACIDIYGDRTDRAEQLVRRSLERHDTYRPWVVAVAANIQTFCDIQAARYEQALERQRWARWFHDRTIGPFAGVYGRCFAGIAAFAQLDVAAAQEHLYEAVDLAQSSAGRSSHAAQLAGALLGELRYEQGELDDAQRLLEGSRELGAESGVVDFMMSSYTVLARLWAHRGAREEAAKLLGEGINVSARLNLTRLQASVVAERIRQLLLAGRVSDARRAAHTLPDASHQSGGVSLAVEQLRTGSLAAVLSAEGDHDGAIALAEGLAHDMSARGQARASLVATIQLAVYQERAARHLSATRSITTALEQGLPTRLWQTFVDGGPEVERIVERLVDRLDEVHGPGSQSLDAAALHGFFSHITDQSKRPRAHALLNARELAIVQMLDRGCSNQHIANALTISVNTVKWYLKEINAKLGAANRSEAVSQARRSGLL